LKDSLQYDKLILSYDTYNTDASLIAQIIIMMPEMPANYTTSFKNEIETRFNNFVQSTNELIEVV